MKHIITILSTVILLLTVGERHSYAQDDVFSGNHLLETCTTETPEVFYCLGFIVAMMDNVQIHYAPERVDQASKAIPICVPKITIGQARDIFVKHLKDTPETRHFKASVEYVVAMREAFPCK